MPWGAIAGAVISGVMASDSADSASSSQAASSAEAVAEQRRQFDLARKDLTPYRETGSGAVSRLATLLGIPGGAEEKSGNANFGALNRKFTLADFWDDPVTKASYAQGLELGRQAIDRMAGARGNRNSGATLKALERFGTDYTGNQAAGSQARYVGDQANTYNRLAGIAGTGQTAANTGAMLGANSANQVGNIMTAEGNARGAASIAQGNIYGGMANTVGQGLADWWKKGKNPTYSTGGYGGSQWSEGG